MLWSLSRESLNKRCGHVGKLNSRASYHVRNRTCQKARVCKPRARTVQLVRQLENAVAQLCVGAIAGPAMLVDEGNKRVLLHAPQLQWCSAHLYARDIP